MMKPNIFLIMVIGVALAQFSCHGLFGPRIKGSGKVIEAERKVGDFSGIELAGIGHVIVEISDTPSVHIEAEDNLMEHLETKVEKGVLVIRVKDNVNLDPTKDIKYLVNATRLSSVSLSGSGHIETPDISTPESPFKMEVSGSGSIETGKLVTNSTEIRLSGSGGVDVLSADHKKGRLGVDLEGSGRVTIRDLKAKSVDGVISGSGRIRVEDGVVEAQNIVINGSGKYVAKSVVSSAARVDIPGSGSARVNVDDTLGVSITGSGSVGYLGNPKVKHSIVGSGTIYQMDN